MECWPTANFCHLPLSLPPIHCQNFWKIYQKTVFHGKWQFGAFKLSQARIPVNLSQAKRKQFGQQFTRTDILNYMLLSNKNNNKWVNNFKLKHKNNLLPTFHHTFLILNTIFINPSNMLAKYPQLDCVCCTVWTHWVKCVSVCVCESNNVPVDVWRKSVVNF